MQLFFARVQGAVNKNHLALLSHSKLRFVMRAIFFYIFFLLLSVQLLMAKSTNGQNVNEVFISLQLKNANLPTAFKKIEKHTDYFFAYQPPQVTSYQVNVESGSRSVGDLLESMLKNTNLSYRQVGNNIIIYKKDQPTGDSKISSADTTVTGTVVNSENNEPVSNASVIVKGTKQGTVTNNSGVFQLELNNLGSTVIISSLGFETQEINLNGRNSLRIALKTANRSLEDVVIVGYGRSSRRAISSSITSIKPEDLNRGAISDVGQLLQGKVAGLNIT